jgi:hypothetical protein
MCKSCANRIGSVSHVLKVASRFQLLKRYSFRLAIQHIWTHVIFALWSGIEDLWNW